MVKLYTLFNTQDPENHNQFGGTYRLGQIKECRTPWVTDKQREGWFVHKHLHCKIISILEITFNSL